MSVNQVPSLDLYDSEMHNLDHLHVKLLKKLDNNTQEIQKLQQFQRTMEQSKEWLVKYNSKESSTLGLGKYKCPKRKAVDKKVEKCLTWLIMKYNKMFRCFLTRTEKALIRSELEEYKIVKNEITKSKREIPVRKEDGTVKKGEKIKVKVLKTPGEIARGLKMNGGITVSQEAVEIVAQKRSCCSCRINEAKEKIIKKVKQEIINQTPCNGLKK